MLVSTVLAATLVASAPAARAPAPLHRALIVGLHDYAKAGRDASGAPVWGDLTGDEDARQVRDTLVAIGRFRPEEVKVISNRATKAEVVQAFQDWLTPKGRVATKDDVLYFHFSGHGDKFGLRAAAGKRGAVTNLPLEGARTGLVFSDSNGGDPTRLLTNVEFEDLLRPLEKASLTITLDTCHAGSGTRRRGAFRVRGRTEPNAEPSPAKSNAPRKGDGFFAEIHPAYTALSACRFDQEALDTGHGGLFTVSYLKALREIAAESAGKHTPSYRELYERTYNLMLQDPLCNGFQNPVIEGDQDHALFGKGSMKSPSYYPLTYAEGVLHVEAGLLFGVREGQHLDLYEPGGSPSNGARRVATVRVRSVRYNRSAVVPEGGAKAAALANDWAYPQADAVDPGGVALNLEALPADRRALILKGLADDRIEVRETPAAEADALLGLDPATHRLTMRGPTGGEIGSFESGEDPRFADGVRNLARWRGVARLQSPPGGDCPTFQLQVVRVKAEDDGNGGHRVTQVLWPTAKPTPDDSRFTKDEFFAFRVRSIKTAPKPLHIAILQLTPARRVEQFWPSREATETSEMVPADGRWHWLEQGSGFTDAALPKGVWDFVVDAADRETKGGTIDGYGGQTFKLFATQERVRYDALLSRGAAGTSPLGTLIQTYSAGGTRSADAGKVPEAYSISTVTVETVKK